MRKSPPGGIVAAARCRRLSNNSALPKSARIGVELGNLRISRWSRESSSRREIVHYPDQNIRIYESRGSTGAKVIQVAPAPAEDVLGRIKPISLARPSEAFDGVARKDAFAGVGKTTMIFPVEAWLSLDEAFAENESKIEHDIEAPDA
jgi:hypothetical protein